jgi:hypothetical protein
LQDPGKDFAKPGWKSCKTRVEILQNPGRNFTRPASRKSLTPQNYSNWAHLSIKKAPSAFGSEMIIVYLQRKTNEF